MKKRIIVSKPEELNNYLKATSFLTWLLLGFVMLSLVAILVWSCISKIEYKIEGNAIVNNGIITFEINESSKDELEVGQVIYIDGKEGTIISIQEDGMPDISIDDLADGSYKYKIIVKIVHPIEYLIKTDN